MNDFEQNLHGLKLKQVVVTGLLSGLLLIFLAGDIWVWKGAMLDLLGAWVLEEGGEDAFWGASIMYSLIALLALGVSAIEHRLFRWSAFVLIALLTLSGLQKLVGGFAEYSEVGWYFCFLFVVNSLINLVTCGYAWCWARFSG